MFIQDLKIGWYLATRQLRRTNPWTTVLIVFVMVLTFLNLTVISGILVGLIEGSVQQNKNSYTGDIIISTLDQKKYIENSPYVISVVKNNSDIKYSSVRYISGGSIEANYKLKTSDKDKVESATAFIAGVNPDDEQSVTNIYKSLVEGNFLVEGDYDKIVVGSDLLKKYSRIEVPGFEAIDSGVGSLVRLRIGDLTREVVIKGIIKSKVDEISRRVFLPENQLRAMLGREDYGINEISIKVKDGSSAEIVRDSLIASNLNSFAKVQTFEEAVPKFLDQIKTTFAILGNIISLIGLVVASITVFIVIFINAITRKKFIGILKAIGIRGRSIELSYIFQSFFYAIMGSLIGVIILYGIIQPFITAHPINFPFSDGILVAPLNETLFKIILLVFATILAGYIPSRMIVRKNTLDSVLGR
jgi:ABC-type lipoprotein release transport system permease subunit